MMLVEVRNQEENEKLVNMVQNITEPNNCGKNFTMGMREHNGVKAYYNFLAFLLNALKLTPNIGSFF